MPKAFTLLGVIFLCSFYSYSQLKQPTFDAEQFYWNWYQGGGWQVVRAQEQRQAAMRQAELEEYEFDNLKKMYNLTVEVNNLTIELHQQIQTKGELWKQSLRSERVELAIKKLATEIKNKAQQLAKLSK